MTKTLRKNINRLHLTKVFPLRSSTCLYLVYYKEIIDGTVENKYKNVEVYIVNLKYLDSNKTFRQSDQKSELNFALIGSEVSKTADKCFFIL